MTFLDDATRPSAPPIEKVTLQQRRHGRRLALYHRHHLGELAGVRAALERLEADQTAAVEVEECIATLDMVRNYRDFGNLCGQHCQLLTMHHTIEDRHIFPLLRDRSEGMRVLIDRLAAEHETVHALLEQLVSASRALTVEPGPLSLSRLREVFGALERVVVSHFGYEERELEAALGFYRVPI